MSEPTTTADANVILLAPNAEDKAWAENTGRKVKGTWREARANAFLANELATAIEDKKFWRVNHLLTTPFAAGFFGKTVTAKTFGNFAEVSERASRDLDNDYWSYREPSKLLAQKYPALAKNYRSNAVGLILAQGAAEGVQILVNSGVASVQTLARDAVYSNNTAALQLLERQAPGVSRETVTIRPVYYDEQVSLLSYAAMQPQSPAAFDWVLARNPEGATLNLLYTAINSGNEAAALKILDAGVSPADTNKWSPLDLAVQAGMAKLVTAILDRNTDPAFRDTVGGTLLVHAVSSRWHTGWDARTAVVDAILEKLPVALEELDKAIGHVPTDSVAYKRIKARIVAQDGGAANAWRLMGPQQVGTVSFDRDNNLQLSEVFNFATSQRLVLSRNLKTGADQLLSSEGFDALTDKKGMEGAKQFLESRTKKPAAPVVKAG
ncbi:MAG TPA: hypothetical protein VEF76_08545 [Patescibacteria group bacterium]|nr:hypothetical protein [Patescibacteria group bacterium]